MKSLNRRFFLQMIGVAGLAPALSGLPGLAASAPQTTPASRLLWAGIRANSTGSASFIHKAQSLGLSRSAAAGVWTKSHAAGAVLARVSRAAPTSVSKGSALGTGGSNGPSARSPFLNVEEPEVFEEDLLSSDSQQNDDGPNQDLPAESEEAAEFRPSH